MSGLYYRRLNNDQIYNSHLKKRGGGKREREGNPLGLVQQRATVSKTGTTKMPNFYDNFPPPLEQLIHLTKKKKRLGEG